MHRLSDAARAEGFLLAFVAAALWGLGPTATKGALAAASPGAVVFLRLGIAALLFRVFAQGRAARSQWDRWTWIGGTALAADFLLYTYGIQYTEAVVAGLLVNAEPVVTILLARWLLAEHLTPHRLIGSALTLAGVILVASEGIRWNEVWRSNHMLGNAAVLLAAVAWSVYAVSQRRAAAHAGLWQRLAGIFSVGFWISAPFTIPFARFSESQAPAWGFLVLLVLFCTVGVYGVYARAQQCLEVSVLAVLLSAIPVFNLIFAAVLLGESLTATRLIATALVIAGVAMIARESARHPASGATISAPLPNPNEVFR